MCNGCVIINLNDDGEVKKKHTLSSQVLLKVESEEYVDDDALILGTPSYPLHHIRLFCFSLFLINLVQYSIV